MSLLQCLESITKKPTEISSKFCLAPLAKGQGITIGNALRRTLLSTIPGIAIVGIRIADINHEFSTIPGVKEDVLEILLNLKQVVFKGVIDEPVNARLNFQGPGIVTTKNIETPANLEVVDPNQHIATMMTYGCLEIEFLIEMGQGYSLSEKNSSISLNDFLAVDAVFMPVQKVNFFVETSRTKSLTEVEKLLLEVTTDGSVTPTQAITTAADKLTKTFALLTNEEELPSIKTALKPVVKENNNKPDVYNKLIEELELSVRAYNCLKRANINTVGDLLSYGQEDLLGLKNFGQKSADEVYENLYKRFGLELTSFKKF